MEMTGDPLYGKIHTLIVGLLDDALLPGQRQELEDLLLNSAAARRAYLEHVQESASLRWLCVEEIKDADGSMVATPASSGAKQPSRNMLWSAAVGILASCLVFVIAAHWFSGGNHAQGETSSNVANASPPATSHGGVAAASTSPAEKIARPVATITGLSGVQWDVPTSAARLLSRCAVGDRMRLKKGAAELTFDVGVQLTVFGPADFEIISPTSIRCLRGRVTTLVEKRGRGFSIETPGAKVKDLGTQFGLSISDEGETEVVVFQGMVDVSYDSKAIKGDAGYRRMEQGDALVLKKSGELQRMVSVQRNSFMESGAREGRRMVEPVIADVQDNIRTAQSAKSYQIVHGGLEDDAPAFVDRNHQWNGLDTSGLPAFLAGADYIMPFNDDKFVRGLELKVRVLRPATLYVFLDNNMAVPDWLWKDFTDTGVDIGLDCAKTEWHKDHSLGVGPGVSIDFEFSVWKREIREPGTITLGGLEPPKLRSQGFNMYGIAAVAADGVALTGGGAK